MKLTVLFLALFFTIKTFSSDCKPIYLKILSVDTSGTTNSSGKYVSLKKLQKEGLINPVIMTQNSSGISFDHVSFLSGDHLLLKGPKGYLRYLFFPVYRSAQGEHSFKIYDAEKFQFLPSIKVPFDWGGVGFETLERKIIINDLSQEVLLLSFKQRGNPQVNAIKINLETLKLEL